MGITRKQVDVGIALVGLVALLALFAAIYGDFDRQIATADPSRLEAVLPGRPTQVGAEGRRSTGEPETFGLDTGAPAAHPLWINELRSAPLGDVMRRNWPSAKSGDADSMVIVHAIMSNCLPYRRRFDGKDLATVQARFAGNNDPELFALNESIWRNCADIYESWDKYDGWRAMIDEAARRGQPYAMIEIGSSRLENPDTFDEGLAFITTALKSGDPVAVSSMADIFDSANAEPGVSIGWLLAACELGLDCSAEGAFMANTCGPFSQTCGVNESVRDFIVRQHGDYGYWLAERKAKDIVEAVKAGRTEDLNIKSDLQVLQTTH